MKPDDEELLQLRARLSTEQIAKLFNVSRSTAYNWLKKARGSSLPAPRHVPFGSSLAALRPDVAASWDQALNGEVTPSQAAPHSNASAWWSCTECDASFERRIADRTKGLGLCTTCSLKRANAGRARPSPKTSLAEVAPEAAKLWHRSLNGSLSPRDVRAKSHKRAWFTCIDCREPRHPFISAVTVGRLRCRQCARRQAARTRAIAGPGESLVDLRPETMEEWDWTRNTEIDPHTVRPGNKQSAWWTCCYCAQSYSSAINSKAQGTPGCRPCQARRAGHNLRRTSFDESLAARYPDLSAEWMTCLDGDWAADTVSPQSSVRVRWKCNNCDETWVTTPGHRVHDGTGCPPCSRVRQVTKRRKPSPGKSLADLAPHLIASWAPSNDRPPSDVYAKSGHSAQWICQECGHQWEAVIAHRANGNGCPICGRKRTTEARRRPTKGRSLADLASDELLGEWDSDGNMPLTPADIPAFSSQLYLWICGNGHRWPASASNRMAGRGCRKCSPIGVSKQEIRLYAELRHVLAPLIGETNCSHDCFLEKARARFRKADMRFGNTIVEMDGSWWHRGMEDRDRAKTRALTEAGYSVVRVRESPLKSLSPMDVQVFDLEDTFDAAATVLFHLARITDATVLHETAQRYLEGETLLAAGQAARMIRERLLQED